MNDIDRIMYLLNEWERTEEEQSEGLRMARNVLCLKPFFRPIGRGYSKHVWENCAIVVCERSDEDLFPYIDEMLLWMQDLNWPGALRIQNRLKQFQDKKHLARGINGFVPALAAVKEESWLLFLSELLDDSTLNQFLAPEVLQILLRYKNRIE